MKEYSPRRPARQSRNRGMNRHSTTKWAMILRSPAENENGGICFSMALSSTRHSRPPAWRRAGARGNPGSFRRINLDTRFRGYDGTQAGLFVLIPKRVFSKEVTKSTKLRSLEISMSEAFVAGVYPEPGRRVFFVVRSNFLIDSASSARCAGKFARAAKTFRCG